MALMFEMYTEKNVGLIITNLQYNLYKLIIYAGNPCHKTSQLTFSWLTNTQNSTCIHQILELCRRFNFTWTKYNPLILILQNVCKSYKILN